MTSYAFNKKETFIMLITETFQSTVYCIDLFLFRRMPDRRSICLWLIDHYIFNRLFYVFVGSPGSPTNNPNTQTPDPGECIHYE